MFDCVQFSLHKTVVEFLATFKTAREFAAIENCILKSVNPFLQFPDQTFMLMTQLDKKLQDNYLFFLEMEFASYFIHLLKVHAFSGSLNI